jgi:hypothetical protein
MTNNDMETFCKERGFLFHKNGSGTFGQNRYWAFYKVENNDSTVFSIEYFPVRNTIKIKKRQLPPRNSRVCRAHDAVANSDENKRTRTGK